MHPRAPPLSSASKLDFEAGEKKATSDFKRAIAEFSRAARRSPEAGNASGDGPSNTSQRNIRNLVQLCCSDHPYLRWIRAGCNLLLRLRTEV